jgi:hypothetical protein
MIQLLLLAQLLQADPYQRGMLAARAGDWERARQEFAAGRTQFPLDKRYAIELAGVEYRAGRLTHARRHLHDALALDPHDAYANDFLGTLYYLDGNVEAALKYWNRVDKPRAGLLDVFPPAPIPPAMLDRAVAFAPGEVLRLNEYRATEAWLRNLNVFGSVRMELAARENGVFDPILRWNPTPSPVKAIAGLGGLPNQLYRYEFENAGHRAISAAALVRWDAQKRRLSGAVQGPLQGNPRRMLRVYADARSETWNLGAPEDFRLRKLEGGASLRFQPSGRFYSETGVVMAGRSYRNTEFVSGFTVAHALAAGYRILNAPENGFTLDADAQWRLGRFFAQRGGRYAKAEASISARWRPRPDSYEAAARASFGRLFGNAPFDEAYMLGRQRDDGLQLRGLVAVRDGRKGRAPVGRQYFVANFDFFRQVWRPGLMAVDMGALLDAGVVSQTVYGSWPRRWAVTPGVQIRVRAPNGFAVVFSYARDPRGGGGFDAGLR